MMKPIPYDEVKYRMFSGDFLLWEGDKLLQKTIQLYGGKSHGSLVVRFTHLKGLEDVRFVIEATGKGVRLRRLSEKLRQEHGRCFLIPSYLTIEQQNAINVRALLDSADEVPYDYNSLFKNIVRRTTIDINKMFCTELCWDYLLTVKACGFKPLPNNFAPRPGDVERVHPYVQYMREVVWLS